MTAYYTIPTSTTPTEDTAYSTTVSLEGSDFILRFQYVQRLDHWVLSVATADDSAIVSGVPIVAGVNLLAGCADARRPPGALFLAPGLTTPGLEGLGAGRVEELVYMTREEAQSL